MAGLRGLPRHGARGRRNVRVLLALSLIELIGLLATSPLHLPATN